MTVTDAERVQRDEREPKCDGQPVAVATITAAGPTTFCAGRQRDADGQWGASWLWSRGRGDKAIDHGQCELGPTP